MLTLLNPKNTIKIIETGRTNFSNLKVWAAYKRVTNRDLFAILEKVGCYCWSIYPTSGDIIKRLYFKFNFVNSQGEFYSVPASFRYDIFLYVLKVHLDQTVGHIETDNYDIFIRRVC